MCVCVCVYACLRECVCVLRVCVFQEAVEWINRSPTQLSFPPSDSTVDMLGVILQGLFGTANVKKNVLCCFLSCCVSPKEGSMLVRVCVDVFCVPKVNFRQAACK